MLSCFPIVFVVYGAKPLLDVLFVGRVRGVEVWHMFAWRIHSLSKRRFVFFVDLSIFGGSCSRFCKLLDVYEL